MNTAIDRYVISKVKKLRDENNMSQREFADAIKANFYKNPGEIYNRILSLFIDKK